MNNTVSNNVSISKASDETSEAARESVEGRVDAATSAVGEQLSRAAHGLDSAGDYLKSADYNGLMKDLVNVIERHPVPVFFTGIGFGYLLGRLVPR